LAKTDIAEQLGVGWIVIVALIVAAVLLTVVTYLVLSLITRDSYVSAYSTIAVLFDATGISVNGNLATMIPLFSREFYTVMALLLVDGLAKIIVIGFVLSFVMQFLILADIQSRVLSVRIKKLKGHVIVCGYSNLAERIAKELDAKGMKYVIVEKDKSKAESLKDTRKNVVDGDFTTDEALKEASIGSAKAILFASENDYDNLLGIVTARHLKKEMEIISTAKEEESVTKMHRAGADLCVVPEILTGIEMGNCLIENMKVR
jgi:voltage-gated potassium channel